jgi:predicted S18 family serine protease
MAIMASRNKRASSATYVLLCLLAASLALNVVLTYVLLYEVQHPTPSTSPTTSPSTGASGSTGVAIGAPYSRNASSIYIVGVVSEGSYAYRGVAMTLQGALMKGEGKVYVSTTPKIGIELQEAAETAFKAAQRFTGVDASKLDLLLSVIGNESIYVVDGPSAGAAVAVLASSLLSNKPIRHDVVITGTIDEYGNIGQVGGIVYKAEAAAKTGAKIFLVPPGQSKDVVYVTVERRVGPFIYIRYYPQLVDVKEYLKEKGYNVQVIEVSTLKEAFTYFSATR